MRRTELIGSREGWTSGSGVRRVGLLALALFVAACSDGSTTVDRDVLPIGGILADHSPGTGDPGQCFGDDAVTYNNLVSGMGTDPEEVNCTANDIDIAIAIVGGVEGMPGYTPGDPVSCTPGGTITLDMTAQLVQNANSDRQDIGVWIGTAQASAVTGECRHYFLDTDLAGTFNGDNTAEAPDHCAGMSVGASANLPLGLITVPCSAVTTDPPGDLQGPGTYLQVGACIGWKIPGGDTQCPDNQANDGVAITPEDFRAGTLLANKSKCNCEPFFIPLIVPGSITIVKNTEGGNGTFAFTHNVGTNSSPSVTSPFNITTSGNTGNQQFGTVLPGTYTVTESGPPAGWQFKNLTCSAGGTPSAQTATIVITPGANVTCTFTNTKLATITIIKNAVGGNATFAFTHTVGTASDPDVNSPFNITTVAGTGQQQFLNVAPGTYTVTESAPPAGWQFTSLSCSAGGSNAGQVATINLAAGASVTCTYTNTKQGTITIVKNTVGGNGTFAFTHTVGTASDPDVTSPFNITTVAGTGQQQFLNVSPGTYTVTESGPPAGWTFSSLSCSAGGSNAGQVATIILPAGGSVTCTFTNNAQGTITIIKNTVGGNGTFAFTHNVGTNSNPTVSTPFNILTAGGTGQQQFLQVNTGTYTVTESGPPAGWQFTSLSCSAGGSNAGQVATIIITAGASVTCTFTNTKLGTITINKNTVGGNGTFAFTHTVGTASDPDVTSPFNILTAGGTGQQQFLNVPAGTYTVTESGPPAGWDFTSLSCSAGGSNAGQVATINLPAGGSVTCTFTNTKRGSITIRKVVLGTGSTFEYTATSNPGTTAITTPFNIVVADNGSNTAVFSNRVPGTYTVTEGPEADYTLTDLACSNAAGVGVVATRTATINLPAGLDITCTFTNQFNSETTRTQGFWSTHKELTAAVWFGGSSGGNTFTGVVDKTLCGVAIDDIGKLLGGFWANIAKTTTGAKRSDLDQAKMRLLQQLLAAILNNAAFGSNPTGAITIAEAKDAFCSGTLEEVNAAAAAMAAFNEGGDSGDFTPGGSANGKEAKDAANIAFWNVLPSSP